jgi:hypothetical protein
LADKAKAGGKAILTDKLEWTITGCTNSQGSGGGGSSTPGTPIIASATKVKSNDKGVLLKGDSGICSGSQTTSGSPLTCSCDFEITYAGQDKVKGV